MILPQEHDKIGLTHHLKKIKLIRFWCRVQIVELIILRGEWIGYNSTKRESEGSVRTKRRRKKAVLIWWTILQRACLLTKSRSTSMTTMTSALHRLTCLTQVCSQTSMRTTWTTLKSTAKVNNACLTHKTSTIQKKKTRRESSNRSTWSPEKTRKLTYLWLSSTASSLGTWAPLSSLCTWSGPLFRTQYLTNSESTTYPTSITLLQFLYGLQWLYLPFCSCTWQFACIIRLVWSHMKLCKIDILFWRIQQLNRRVPAKRSVLTTQAQ